MKRDNYRVNRARVTEKITGTIKKLVESEGDTGKKKKHPAKWYQAKVKELLKLDDKDNPSLRSYEKELQEIRRVLNKNPLEQPWSIGACTKYDIPADIIPVLINEINRLINSPIHSGYLQAIGNDIKKIPTITIRQALWFARLYPATNTVAKKYYPTAKWQHYCLATLARLYAHKEQLNEISNKNPLDTSELDYRYFVLEDLSPEALADARLEYTLTDDIKERDVLQEVW